MKGFSARELLRRFPNASRATLQANCGNIEPETVRPTKAAEPEREEVPKVLDSVAIYGQIRGGKNNMIVTKRGKHIPKKTWAEWRDKAVECVASQLPANWNPINRPTKVRIKYVAGDLKRRDFPAICDSIWHVLERAGVVTDDTFLWPAESTREYDKQNPRAIITFL